MKRVKVLALIGIILSIIGLYGSVILLGEEDSDGIIGLVLYGFMLWLSIEVRNIKEKEPKKIKAKK